MRAYLLGYNHGKNDGYYSTLIERGGCEKSYDESLDVEYVEWYKVLEIIDQMERENMECNDDPAKTILQIEYHNFRAAVLKLKEGEQE